MANLMIDTGRWGRSTDEASPGKDMRAVEDGSIFFQGCFVEEGTGSPSKSIPFFVRASGLILPVVAMRSRSVGKALP